MTVFGFSTAPAGGDFLPIVKYDARAGRLFRVDRVETANGFASDAIDITSTFKAIVDFENVESGWINFPAGSAPSFVLVPMGTPLPDKPSANHKNGIRFMLKLSKESGGAKPVRELSGTSKVFLSGVEAAYLAYKAEKDANPGKLPVLTLEKTTPITTGQGDKRSTNYQPIFKISGWAPRGDLTFQPKGGSAQPAQPAAAAGNAAPSTGSTRVEAPKAAQPETTAAEDDFG